MTQFIVSPEKKYIDFLNKSIFCNVKRRKRLYHIFLGGQMSTLIQSLQEMEKHNSIFEHNIRTLDVPTCADFLVNGKIAPVAFAETGETLSTKDSAAVSKAFEKTYALSQNKILAAKGTNPSPCTGKRVAVLFSGGPAAGGHNVVVGLKKAIGPDNTLLGVKAGPKGLLEGNLFEITDEAVAKIANTGGFDFLGSDRTKLKRMNSSQK